MTNQPEVKSATRTYLIETQFYPDGTRKARCWGNIGEDTGLSIAETLNLFLQEENHPRISKAALRKGVYLMEESDGNEWVSTTLLKSITLTSKKNKELYFQGGRRLLAIKGIRTLVPVSGIQYFKTNPHWYVENSEGVTEYEEN